MKTRPVKPSSAARKNKPDKKHPAVPASNATFNAQSRRVLAQHYRAKYGVK